MSEPRYEPYFRGGKHVGYNLLNPEDAPAMTPIPEPTPYDLAAMSDSSHESMMYRAQVKCEALERDNAALRDEMAEARRKGWEECREAAAKAMQYPEPTEK